MIHTLYYYGDDRPATGLSAAQISGALNDPAGVLWMDLEGCSDDEARATLAAVGIRDATVDLCLTRDRQPRLDDTGSHVFFNAPVIPERDGAQTAQPADVGMFVGRNYLISHHRETLRPITDARERIAADADVLARGPDAVAGLVLHALSGQTAGAIAHELEQMQTLESRMLRGEGGDVLVRYYAAVARIEAVGRRVAAVAEVTDQLAWGEFEVISTDNQLLFREVHDLLRASSESADDGANRASLAVTAYAAAATASLHGKVRLMALMQAVLLPAILLAAFFGMRFDNLPLFDASSGWLVVVGAMSMVAVAMALVYRWWR